MRGNLMAMSTQELDRASIIQLVLDKRLTQVRRLCRSVRCEDCQIHYFLSRFGLLLCKQSKMTRTYMAWIHPAQLFID